MTQAPRLLLASADPGLRAHWQRALGAASQAASLEALQAWAAQGPGVVWLDLCLPGLPGWQGAPWPGLLAGGARLVAASSSPDEAQAIAALDAGCAGYCHAYADAATLQQVQQVVALGQIWVGRTLMQRLLRSAQRVAPPQSPVDADWAQPLTDRERQVAVLAANGASNQAIARDCGISERTVKAHLSAVFAKLHVTDRLQLALRVHGIS